jgi:hypothetical protein
MIDRSDVDGYDASRPWADAGVQVGYRLPPLGEELQRYRSSGSP